MPEFLYEETSPFALDTNAHECDRLRSTTCLAATSQASSCDARDELLAFHHLYLPRGDRLQCRIN